MEKEEQEREAGEPAGLVSGPDITVVENHEGRSGSALQAHGPLTLNSMPQEVLEHILTHLSPYQEMDAAKLVSKQWNQAVKAVVKQKMRRFYQSLLKCKVSWSQFTKEHSPSHCEGGHIGISDRFSHSASYHEGSMYIFGGCTSTNTTFNDLWRFDLTKRQWIRPVAMGTYPSPKACATMVVYNGNLVLFGGWSHPIPYPLHQSAHYFSELHVYSPVTNRWSHIISLGQEPEALGGHSASVIGHLMVVFGGSPRPGLGTNNLWVFNFLKASWKLQSVNRDAKPEPRYGQYQTTLDDMHILIMGGCVGQNRVYHDIWLLTLHSNDPWQWTKLTIKHPELAASQTWCHAACRVNNSIVVVAKSSKQRNARNIKPDILHKKPVMEASSVSHNSGTDNSLVNSGTVGRHNFDSHVHLQKQLQGQPQQLPTVGKPDDGASEEEDERVSQMHNCSSLLALQQRLYRECVNLPDPDNHHHNPNSSDRDEPEGHFHRLSNRWGSETQAEQSERQQLQHHQNQHAAQNQEQFDEQPQFGNLQRINNALPNIRGRGGTAMPSIRPNAMNNRQRQLEALQRQEELLRSKSRALAAARKQKPSVNALDSDIEEQIPDIVPTKNKMDVHVMDISCVLTDGTAEWKPLSELQPQGAPVETICGSMLEGRGELVLFGGVVRDMNSPVVTNTAINKLFFLQPQ